MFAPQGVLCNSVHIYIKSCASEAYLYNQMCLIAERLTIVVQLKH